MNGMLAERGDSNPVEVLPPVGEAGFLRR